LKFRPETYRFKKSNLKSKKILKKDEKNFKKNFKKKLKEKFQAEAKLTNPSSPARNLEIKAITTKKVKEETFSFFKINNLKIFQNQNLPI